jgi:DNA-binding MarR family transcriptional regulator
MICLVALNNFVQLNNSGSDRSDNWLRLSVFLNRYVEHIGRRSNLTNHEAAVLTAIQWMDNHIECLLNQAQMAGLLSMTPSLLSSRVKKLRARGLCEPLPQQERSLHGIDNNREEYLRVTPKGTRALEQYALMMFELPSKIAEGIVNNEEYRGVLNRVNDILDDQLSLRFQEARQQ